MYGHKLATFDGQSQGGGAHAQNRSRLREIKPSLQFTTLRRIRRYVPHFAQRGYSLQSPIIAVPGAQVVSVQDSCNVLIRTDAHQQLYSFSG